MASMALQTCLLDAVSGSVAFQGQPFYQIANVQPYNLDVPVNPVAITYPRSAQQIADVVQCAVQSSMKVQARSGGHSYANYGLGAGNDNTVVVDLKNMKQFSMDTTTWQATVGSGTLLGELTERLHNNGQRAMPYGISPTIGIGGHATIGGLGPTGRQWGLTLDQILEVEVVLANSSIVRASDTQNSDLFWAIRGAAAGFGIVSEFKFRTHPEPGNNVQYSFNFGALDAKSKAQAFLKWQELISDPSLSRKFASTVTVTQDLGMVISGTFFGSREEYDSLNIESRLPSTNDSMVQIQGWLGTVANWADDLALKLVGHTPSHFYSKSLGYTKNDLLSEGVAENLFQYLEDAEKGSPIWFLVFDLGAGAISDVASDATSYGHRDALFFHQSYIVNLLGEVTQASRDFLDGINNLVSTALPNHPQGAYPGYVDPELGAQAQQDYWEGNVPRLEQIKAMVDPADVFHNPQSIRPSAARKMRRDPSPSGPGASKPSIG